MGALQSSRSELKGLSDKQAIFVLEYIVDMNGARAAKEAGYAKPDSQASKLLKLPKVKKALSLLLKPKLEEVELTTENILRQLSRFLFRDISDFIDSDGFLIQDLSQLPEGLRQCVEGFEVHDEYNGDGELTGQRTKVKFVSKARSIELAMRYARLLDPGNTTNVNVGVNIPWDKMYEKADTAIPEDPFKAVIEEAAGDKHAEA